MFFKINSQSRARRLANRGYTLSEVLIVTTLLGIFSSFMVGIVAPVVSAPNKEQSKVDTLQAAAQGLYEIQRDIRMSDTSGVYSCANNGGTVTCSQPSTSQATSIIVMITPLANGQLNWDISNVSNYGLPSWQGALVYWLAPNNSGSNDLERALVGTGVLGVLGSGPLSSFSPTAATAANSAQASGGTTIAHNINSMSVFINTSTHIVGLDLTAKSTDGGSINSTKYASDTYARN
jgi:prepilin-type N-terminal cleavage/methylation domain-containing protein